MNRSTVAVSCMVAGAASLTAGAVVVAGLGWGLLVLGALLCIVAVLLGWN